jgi:hypothetical protein
MPPEERDALRSKYRSMALLTFLLGLALVILSFFNVVAVRLLEPLLKGGLPRTPFSDLIGPMLRFSIRSSWVLAPLGVLFAFAGWRAITGSPLGRIGMWRAAWAAVIAMLLLAGIWELEAVRGHYGIGFHFLGISTHAGQAVLCWLAARFLAGAPLIEALDATSASSAGAS